MSSPGYRLNGRQIKNTARTANALALAEGSRLGVEQIRVVLESTVVDVAEVEVAEKSEAEKGSREAENDSRSWLPAPTIELVTALNCLILLIAYILFWFCIL